MQIFGAWHCGNHYCDWSLVRDMTEFDQAKHWLIAGTNGQPSVNLIVLSFVNPLKMLNQTDTGLNGMIPAGMTQAIVNNQTDRDPPYTFSLKGQHKHCFWNLLRECYESINMILDLEW